MGMPVIIYGKPGAGKTHSLKQLLADKRFEDHVFYVNVESKHLPFRGHFKYHMETADPKTIITAVKKCPCPIIIVDDATYIMSKLFMKHHSAGLKGAAVYDLYNDIADSMWQLFEAVKNDTPEGTIVYFIFHEDRSDDGQTKLLTIGRLLDQKVMLEGIVTICLHAAYVNGRHVFKTHTDGADITKSPEDLFETDEIENDLAYVDDTIREYYWYYHIGHGVMPPTPVMPKIAS